MTYEGLVDAEFWALPAQASHLELGTRLHEDFSGLHSFTSRVLEVVAKVAALIQGPLRLLMKRRSPQRIRKAAAKNHPCVGGLRARWLQVQAGPVQAGKTACRNLQVHISKVVKPLQPNNAKQKCKTPLVRTWTRMSKT